MAILKNPSAATSGTIANIGTVSDYVLAPHDPDRWTGSFAAVLGLEPRVLAGPVPKTPEFQKATRYSVRWHEAFLEIDECDDPQEAVARVLRVSDKFFYDRHRRKPIARLRYLDADRYDPGRKFMKATEETAHLLYSNIHCDKHPMVVRLEEIHRDLDRFLNGHRNINDARFLPVAAMSKCLARLAQILRAAE